MKSLLISFYSFGLYPKVIRSCIVYSKLASLSKDTPIIQVDISPKSFSYNRVINKIRSDPNNVMELISRDSFHNVETMLKHFDYIDEIVRSNLSYIQINRGGVNLIRITMNDPNLSSQSSRGAFIELNSYGEELFKHVQSRYRFLSVLLASGVFIFFGYSLNSLFKAVNEIKPSLKREK